MLKNTDASITKQNIINQVESILADQHLTIVEKNIQKPWGAGYRFHENDVTKFLQAYYPNTDTTPYIQGQSVSPKILVITPNTRLSWQYHHRRAEVWRCIDGPVGVITSDTDKEQELQTLQSEEIITINKGERHRIVGLDNWAIIAEIWQHTDPENPSQEADIVRLADDFNRK